MKLGTYTNLSCQLLGLALLWSSAACGIRSTLLQEEDAGAVTEDEGAQSSSSSSSTSSGGRSGTSTTPRAGRSGSGAAGTAGAAQATAGRAARAGRGGSAGRGGTGGSGGAGGAGGKTDAADSGEDKKDEQQAGSGGEKAEQAGAGGEQAGAGGEMSGVAGMGAAAGSGGAAGEPAAGTGGAPAHVPGTLSQLTPQEVTTLCSNIDMATASLPWAEAIRGYCSRRGSAQPAMCATLRDMCVTGPELTPVCAQTIPDCPNITTTEYQRCRIDTLYRFVEDNRMITCETMPPLPGPSVIPSCDLIYDRCPAARALRVL